MNTKAAKTLTATIAATAFALGSFAATAPAEEETIPTPDTPILMIGDSMMRLLGHEMEKAFKKAGIQPAVAFSSLGSGLVRSSVFDWNAKIDELIAEHKPATVFVNIGTNDRQALEVEGVGMIRYESADEWRAAYSKCIGGVMDRLIAGGVKRIIWMLLPSMNDTATHEHAMLVNEIVTEQAAAEKRKDVVTLLDLGPMLSSRPGKYSRYVTDKKTGNALTVRDPDGVHLSVEGAKYVSRRILETYWNK